MEICFVFMQIVRKKMKDVLEDRTEAIAKPRRMY